MGFEDLMPKTNTPNVAIVPTDLMAENVERRPGNFVTSALDLLARPGYASAALTGTLLEKGLGGLGDALYNAGSEIISPKARLSYSDLIKRYAPDYAKEYPVGTSILGLAADIALDPTTYIGTGLIGKGTKLAVGGKTLFVTKEGEKIFARILWGEGASIAKQFGPDLADNFVRRSMGVVDDLISEVRVRQTAEKNFLELLTTIPKSEAKKLASESLTSRVFNAIGSTQLGQKLSAINKEYGFAGIFNRNANLPEEFVALRDHITNIKKRVDGEAIIDAAAVFKLPKESQKKLSDLAFEIDRQRFALSQGFQNTVLEKGYKGGWSNAEETALIDKMLATVNLSPEEHAAFARWTQRTKEFHDLDSSVEILREQMRQYDPKLYEAINAGAKNLPGFRAGQTINFIDPSTTAPEFYAAITYAQRTASARRAGTDDLFYFGLEKIFGVKNVRDLPRWVRDDVVFMGDALYSHTPEALKGPLKVYDKFMSFFRTFATVARPSFAVRQLFSNTFQSFLADGADAFKILNPVSAVEGAIVALGRQAEKGGKPSFVANWLAKHGPLTTGGEAIDILAGPESMLQGLVVKSPFGHSYTGSEIRNMIKDLGVAAGTDIRGDNLAANIGKEVSAKLGLGSMAVDGLKYWRWPSMIEDYARTTTFINGLRAGYTPKKAAEIVNKALFNYSEGLSITERQLFRRVIPFYTFQRFAIPLLIETALTKPGRVASLAKGQKAAMEIWGKWFTGDELTDNERQVLPDYLLEQPTSFVGFDAKGQATFNTFINFTPLDAMNIAAFDKQGNISFAATMKKVLLAQITPAIKMPIEMAVEKQFFTDRTFQESTKAGDIYRFLDTLPQPIKDAMSYELVYDQRKGKQVAYINPYITYTISNVFPAMGEVVKLGDQKNSPLEKAMGFLFGIGTRKFDLAEQQRFKAIGARKEIEDLKDSIRKAAFQGRTNMVSYYQSELQETLGQIQERYAAGGEVRGAIAQPIVTPEK